MRRARDASNRAATVAQFALPGSHNGVAMPRFDANCSMPEARRFLRSLFDAAVAAALPSAGSIAAFLPPPPKGRTLVLGAGKAGGEMAAAVETAWPAGAAMSGLVVTRYDYMPASFAAAQARRATRIEVAEAGHPVPDAAGRRAAERIAALARGLTPDDLVLCLISGGASS